MISWRAFQPRLAFKLAVGGEVVGVGAQQAGFEATGGGKRLKSLMASLSIGTRFRRRELRDQQIQHAGAASVGASPGVAAFFAETGN